MEYITLGNLNVSRFILGSNPFSGFSHQSPEMDQIMRRFFSTARIKELLFQAEDLGINTLIARTDHHVMRFLLEYWDEGGQLQWFAQTCPEIGDHPTCITRAVIGGAIACHLHGGVMDFLYAQGRLDEIPPVVQMIRDNGLLAGIAAHNPKVIEWAEAYLDIDYYMCSYYNSAHRDERAEHVSGMEEWFIDEDRQAMTRLIKTLSRPAIHYKVLAAGRNNPEEAFDIVAQTMRPKDMVCVGIFHRDQALMLQQDIDILNSALERRQSTISV